MMIERFTNSILGEQYLLSTADISKVFGRFNMLNHKFVVILNEADGKDMFQNSEKMKSLITEPYINWEDKFQKPVTLNSFSRFKLFSNNSTPVKVSTMDRRINAFECTDKVRPDMHKSKDQIRLFFDCT